MLKKISWVIMGIGLGAILVFAGFGILRSSRNTPTFDTAGYILQGDAEEVKGVSFRAGESYASTLAGQISFSDTEGKKAAVSKESFVHFEDNSIMALSDGILLDFNDLSENFINNYYISSGLRLTDANGTYTAEATAGTMKFGENMWKLSDRKYMIQSPTLKVSLSEEDVREVSDYVQVVITEDGIVHLLTPENLWMTISEDCYIETAGGVRIYPVAQLIDNGTYKLSTAKLSVAPDDAIVLSELETRRQIVPELNITAVDGEDGRDGQDGKEGEAGQKGSDGTRGTNGKNGGTGTAGKDALVESTTNSALPTMSIGEWNITATGLSGVINVKDNGGSLQAIGEMQNGDETKYPGSVTITDVKTGEVIPCYQIADEHETSTGFNFYNGSEAVRFFTHGSPLKPDTAYQLSVVAYYKAPDQTNMIYSREFISRVFYTDSAGVVLAYEKATQDSITISGKVTSGAGNIAKATAYLLTPEQNKSFTAASITNAASYTGSKELGVNGTSEVTFDRLTPNTSYIARVYVETTGGMKLLTEQELEVITLKRVPTFDKDKKPSANYNRATGTFEIFRPVVTDPDGGAVSYTYTAYKLNGSAWEEAGKRTISPSTGEPVEFHLDAGTQYCFGVEMAFNDNEKLVYYDLGRSDVVKSEGDTMPKLTLQKLTAGADYNKLQGTLRISLGSKSAIQIDEQHPLVLELYADQLSQNETVELKNGTTVKKENHYSYTLKNITVGENTNYVDVEIELENLCKNTNYAISAAGWLNVGDDNGFVQRAIGTVTFHTYATPVLATTWTQTSGTTGASISRMLSIKIDDKSSTDTYTGRTEYIEGQLKQGQVVVELFSGTGAGKLRIAQKNFNEAEDLNAIFSEGGLEITESVFGNPQLNSQGNYTLTVSQVADKTYGMSLGYVNTFDDIINPSEVVSAEPTPPDLLQEPSQGVKAEPIYNKDIAKYGGRENESLPDEAIVGYTLQATYDNVQRIGKKITYYAFEYNTFFNTLKDGKDPIKKGTPLKTMTLDIDSGSNSVPKVAVLFGGTKTDTPTLYNGYYTYWAGEAQAPDNTALVEGMGRGFRYIFAYTAEYAGGSTEETSNRLYPYDHKEYNDYNKVRGGMKENGVMVGNGVAYILNSGMCEAPQILPDFHTYVFNTTQNEVTGPLATTALGTVTLHYTWRDPDKLIIKDETAKNTTISYPNGNNVASQNIQKDQIGEGWYELKIPYVMQKGADTVLTPEVNVCAYRLNYDEVLSRFKLDKDEKTLKIGMIPLDWSWEQQFAHYTGTNAVNVTLDTGNMSDNYIAFRFNESDASANALVSRAVAMKLKIQLQGEPGTAKEFTLPLVHDVNGTYAKLATGLLGNEFFNKTFEVTEAKLLYDTGVQGWEIADEAKVNDESSYFVLQYTGDAIEEKYELSEYLGATALDNVRANGALMQLVSVFDIKTLRTAINAASPELDTKAGITTKSLINKNGFAAIRYLYPDRGGVDTNNSASVQQLSGRYMVPKRVGEYTLAFAGGTNFGTLNQMTPTISKPVFRATSDKISIENQQSGGGGSTNFTVSGLGESGGKIYAAAYPSYEDAEKLQNQKAQVEIRIGADGRPNTDGNFELKSLTPNTKYYVAFHYQNASGKSVLLLTSETAQKAIYEVTTSDNAVINVRKWEYHNDSYFEKSLTMEFTINRVFEIGLTYDIYASERDIVDGKDPLVTDAKMREDNILTAPTDPAYENNLKLVLTPGESRAKLKPGNTYYLKITATEKGGNVAGHTVLPFTITPIGNYGALIYVSHASSEDIKFLVTINDPQFSLMSRNKGAGSTAEAALYAVRFTDEDGRRLYTNYDDKMYSANELKKEFVLNSAALQNRGTQSIKEGKLYKMLIYAVPDIEHKGSVLLAGETAPRTWDMFFSKNGDLAGCGKEFHKIIDGFWNADGSHKTTDAERQLLIAAKAQQTTTAEGWILNENSIFADRANPTTVRILFQESVGLIKDAEPVFKRIDWSVNGMSNDGTPVMASGTSLYSKTDALLKLGESAGYEQYYYDIPYELGNGRYTIVLQFRLNESDAAATKTVTVLSAG